MSSSYTTLEPLVIRASAGTGKTTDLTSRFISILRMGEAPERILATTFTKKAAGEIQQRVFSKLSQAALHKEKAEELGALLGGPPFTSGEALSLLRRLIDSQNRLHICTLDSFFSQIARSFSFELGFFPDWRISTGSETDEVYREAIQKVFHHQERALLSQLLGVAGQGVNNRAIHRWLQGQVILLQGLYRDAPRSAWHWIKADEPLCEEEFKRVRHELELVPPIPKKDGTPNAKWMDSRAKALRLIDSGQWIELAELSITTAVVEKTYKYGQGSLPPEWIAPYSLIIKHARAVMLGSISRRLSALYEILGVFEREYERERVRTHTLGFDDVKYKIARSALMGSLHDVYYRLDTKLRHLLLDEFQDTSAQDWNILEPMAEEILSQVSGERSFFCVGDVKQAIYGWRGGVAEIFGRLESRFPQITVRPKQRTYRCAPAIIEAVNQVFTNLPRGTSLGDSHAAAIEWCSGFEPHSTAKESLEGYVEIREPAFEGEEQRSPYREAALLVKDLVVRYPHASIGVLVWRNSAGLQILEELSAEDINLKATQNSSESLAESALIRSFLSLFTLVDHPGDSIVRYHVANSRLAEVFSYTEWQNIESARQLSRKIREEILVEGYSSVVTHAHTALAETLTEREAEHMSELLQCAVTFDQKRGLRADDFVAFIERESIKSTHESPIKVMTVHKSKGLEFDIVVLPDLHAPIYKNLSLLVSRTDPTEPPSRISFAGKKGLRAIEPTLAEMYQNMRSAEIKQGLSALYVALTRPRQALYMISISGKSNSTVAYSEVLSETLGFERGSAVKAVAGSPEWNFRGAEVGDPAPVFIAPASVVMSAANGVRSKLKRERPSKLYQSEAVEFSAVQRSGVIDGFRRGTILHRFFQEVEWLEGGVPTVQVLERASREIGVNAVERVALVEEFHRYLSQATVGQHLSQAQYPENARLEVFREQRFSVIDSEVLLVGSFDRVVLVEEPGKERRVDILDFKTDQLTSLESACLEEKVAFYSAQMQAYRRAASQLFSLPVERVCATLLFVSLDKAFKVEG